VAGDFSDDDSIDNLLDYFHETWIGELNMRGGSNLLRSNNSIEAEHNMFSNLVSIVQPAISQWAEKFRREPLEFEIHIAENCQDRELKPSNGSYRKLDINIQRLIADQSKIELAKYLNEVAIDMSL
jgi:hypothetical protein